MEKTAPVEEEEDLDRPVTLREFRNEFKMLIEKITADRLQDRKEREEEKAKEAADRAAEKAQAETDRAAEKAQAEADRAAEREKVQRLWEEGKMVECVRLFFKMNQGNNYHCCNSDYYQRIKVE
jgi:hypothetical protein